jgi:hypothetical protein
MHHVLTDLRTSRKNRHAREEVSHPPPKPIVESILQKEQRIAEIMGEIKALLRKSA